MSVGPPVGAIPLLPAPSGSGILWPMVVFSSILLGLVGSLVGWSISQVLFGPLLAMSSKISQQSSGADPGPPRFRVRLMNTSHLRSVIDVRIEARLRLYGLDHDRPGEALILHPGTSADSEMRIRPRTAISITIDTDQLSDFARSRLRELGKQELVERCDAGTLTLTELLEVRPATCVELGCTTKHELAQTRATLHLVTISSDAWSGAQRVRVSPKYEREQVIEAAFCYMNDDGEENIWKPLFALHRRIQLRHQKSDRLRLDVDTAP